MTLTNSPPATVEYIDDGDMLRVNGVLYKRMRTENGVYSKEYRRAYMRKYRSRRIDR